MKKEKREYPPVQIGQIYKERDKRFERYVKVVAIERARAIVQPCDEVGGILKGWRTTKIRLTNLQTRFTLLSDSLYGE